MSRLTNQSDSGDRSQESVQVTGEQYLCSGTLGTSPPDPTCRLVSSTQ